MNNLDAIDLEIVRVQREEYPLYRSMEDEHVINTLKNYEPDLYASLRFRTSVEVIWKLFIEATRLDEFATKILDMTANSANRK